MRTKVPRLSAAAARRISLGAQGFTDPRPSGRVDRRHLRRVMGRLNYLQLDSVPVVMRTQYMPAFSRLGPYDPDLHDQIAYQDDEWIEAWCHEASLIPVEDEPLLRFQKDRARRGETWGGLVEFAAKEQAYIDEVRAQIRERPLAPGELNDPRPREGEWWGSRSLGSVALDWMFRVGEVGIRRKPGFVKEFDLMERIVPEEIRDLPTPSEQDATRELLRRGAKSLGVFSLPELIDYHRVPKKAGRLRALELIEEGEFAEVSVDGWERPAYLHPDATRPRKINACTLLSPFDPVVWHRERAQRLFDFEYKIEIYVPGPKRKYGYYVLPFLLGDKIVGRVDLKTDRTDGVLRLLGAFSEPGNDRDEVIEGLHTALDDLAVFVGVDGWTVSGHAGDLITDLGRR